ncbi:MAG: Hsp20/alpha crystallin family protein [Candidatus Omnitrophota bacterium]
MKNFLVTRKKEDPLFVDVKWPRLFDEWLGFPRYNEFAFTRAGFAVDIYEKEDKIIAKAEIPGVKQEDLKLDVDGNLLTITAEKKQEKETKNEDYYQSEVSYGKFQRTVELPYEVKAEQAKAVYKNGILNVELPKDENCKQKQIQIEVK